MKGDFVVLPCDLVCELGGEVLAESWMVRQAGLGGETGPEKWNHKFRLGFGGERIGRRGGLGVWYQTKADETTRKEETDFIATLPSESATVPPPRNSLLSDIHHLAYSIPTDALNDLVDEQKSFAIRRSLLRKYGQVKLRTSYRNAHIYFFPFWVIEFIKRNKEFDSISEDVIGWWSKATWQRGLGAKLGMTDLFGNFQEADNDDNTGPIMFQDELIDLMNMTSTGLHDSHGQSLTRQQGQLLASRIRQHVSEQSKPLPPKTDSEPSIPPILAYVQPFHSTAPLIRRVDTGPLLLTTSLRLARFEALDESGPAGPSPFAHKRKIATPSGVGQRCTVTRADCLLDENVVVEEKAVIKECVVGANCRIRTGARLTRCLLMDGVTVGERCQLNGCILGKKSRIGQEAVLRDCEVQGGYEISDRGSFAIMLPSLSFGVELLTLRWPHQPMQKARSLWSLKAWMILL